MNLLQVFFVNFFITKLVVHSLNPLLLPSNNRDVVEEKWRANLWRHTINLLNQHKALCKFENNDIGFLQFGNDTNGFIDQFFAKFYQQFNDRAIVMTRVPLIRKYTVFTKSTLTVLLMCYYDKKQFRTFLKDIQLSIFWQSVAPILVIPTYPITFNNYNWLNRMFGFFKYEYLFNVGVIYYSLAYDRVERVGYNPFKEEPIEIEPKYLFYNKVKNLNGFELRITQYDDIPRSLVNDNGGVNGMDGKALETVCNKLNATYRVIKATGDPETSYSNVVFDLVTRRADLNFNQRIFWSTNYLNSIVIPIYPYEHESIMLMIPSARAVLPYRHFIDPFQRELWFTIGLIVAVATTIWFIIKPRIKTLRTQSEIVDIFFDVCRMHLGSPLSRIVTNSRERYIFMLISLYTFILLQMYQTKLTSFLMSKRYMHNYETLAEVNNSDLELVLSKNYKALFNHFLETSPMKNNLIETNYSMWQFKQICADDREWDNLKKAFFVTKQEADTFKITIFNEIHGEKILEPISEKILTSAASYMVPRNSPFEQEISNIIRRMRESGLFEYFKAVGLYDVWRHLNVTSDYKMYLTPPITQRVKLTSDVFIPIIHVYGFIAGITIVCFLLELSSAWLKMLAGRLRKRIRRCQIKAHLKRWFVKFILYWLKD